MTLELGTLCMEGGTLERRAIFADLSSRMLKYFLVFGCQGYIRVMESVELTYVIKKV